MPEKTVRIIYVEWIDSAKFGSGVWSDRDSVLQSSNYVLCKSCGFLLKESKDSITIVGHMGGDTGEESVSGDLTIPKVAIKKRKWLSK